MATRTRKVEIVVTAQVEADAENGIPCFYEQDGETLRKLEKSDFGKSRAARIAWTNYGILKADERRTSTEQSKTKEDLLRAQLKRLQEKQAKVLAQLGDDEHIDQIVIGVADDDEVAEVA